MKLLLKIFTFIIITALILLAVLLLLPDSQYQKLTRYAIEKATGRSTQIESLSTERSLEPKITIKGLSLANPKWAKDSDMVSAEEFQLSLNLKELITGKFNFHLTSDALNVNLIRNEQGEPNWIFSEAKPDPKEQHNQPRAERQAAAKSLANTVLHHLNMDNFKLNFEDRQTQRKHQLVIEQMQVSEFDEAATQSLSGKGSVDHFPFTINGQTGDFSELHNNNQVPVKLTFNLANIQLGLDGKINTDESTHDIDLNSKIDFSMPDFDLISHFIDQKFPEQWGDISASSQLNMKAGTASLNDLKVSMERGLSVNINGDIGNLNQLEQFNLDLKAQLKSIAELSAFTPSPLPELGPITFAGKIESKDKALQLNTAKLTYNSEYGNADLGGTIADLIAFAGVDLKLNTQLPDLSIVSLFADTELPHTGPVSLTGDITGGLDTDLSANNLSLIYQQTGVKLDASGQITQLINSGGKADIDIKGSIDSIASLSNFAGDSLPDIGPITLSNKITGALDNPTIHQLLAKIDDSVLSGELSANIGSISELEDLSVSADLSSDSIGTLLTKLGTESSSNAAAKLSAKLHKKADHLSLSEFVFTAAKSKVQSTMSFDNFFSAENRNKLKGSVDIENLNLVDILGETEKTTAAAEQPADGETDGIKIPDTPLPLQWQRDNDVDLKLNIKSFSSDFLSLKDTLLTVTTEQGDLNIKSDKANINQGDGSLLVNLNAAQTPAKLKLKTDIKDFKFIQSQNVDSDSLFDSDSNANINLDFNGSGDSVAQLLATTNGQGIVDINNLVINNNLIQFVSGDLVKEATAKLNPLNQQNDTTIIECAAVKINFDNGHMKTPNGYIADAKAFAITGKADVNFNDQKIDIELSTNPKEGLGLGLGDLARAIKVGGTIEQPKIGLNAEGVAEIGATIGAAVVTGGVSLLAQGQVNKLKAKSESCKKILNGEG